VYVKEAKKRHLAKRAVDNFQAKHGKGLIHFMANENISGVEVRSE
jgi:hypothetical protein